tara:strand:+ start:1365 stop:1487 length:123 start_codon:yes stop_codon:yes gene_type:complete
MQHVIRRPTKRFENYEKRDHEKAAKKTVGKVLQKTLNNGR